MAPITGKTIVVTGPTGQVALPITRPWPATTPWIGLARFTDAAERERLEADGVTCIPTKPRRRRVRRGPHRRRLRDQPGGGEVGPLGGRLRANAEAAGLLMAHCRTATAFLHCSSTGVYQPAGAHLLVETDPLGDNHRAIMPTYSIARSPPRPWCARRPASSAYPPPSPG